MAMRMDAVLNLDAAGFTGQLQGAKGSLSGFTGQLQGANGNLSGTGASLVGVAAALGGVIASFAGIRAIMSGVKGALDMGGELTDVSAQTGIAVRDLVILRQAFDDAGVGAAQVPTAINMMQKALTGVSESGEPTNKMFERLGLSIEQLKGMSAMDQFQAIGNAINGLGSDAERTGATMAIFGRSGGALKALFANPQAIEQTTAALGSMPDVVARNAAAFDMIGDQIGQMKTKMKGLWAGVLEGMAPAVEQVTSALNGIDLAGLGVKIGNVVGILIEAFKSGQIGEMLWLGLKIGLGTAINYITGTLGSGQFWKGIGMIIIGALQGIGGMLLKSLLSPLSYLQAAYDQWIAGIFEAVGKIPGLGKALGLAGYKNEKTYKERVAENQNSSFLKDAAEMSMEMSGALLKEGGKAIADGVRDGDFIDNDLAMVKLGTIVQGLKVDLDARKAELAKKAGGQSLPGVGEALAAPQKAVKAQDSNADRFTKIGWFVGAQGSNAGAIGFSRRTAMATEQSLAYLKRIAAGMGRGNAQPALVTA